MTKTSAAVIACLFTVLSMHPAKAEFLSLRGSAAIEADSQMFEKKKQNTSVKGLGRDWKLQPPLISHKIDKDKINLNENSCMKCHSEEETVFSGAPPTPPSHNLDSDGKKLAGISMRRHFCMQCHVPQANAKPLVENVFVPAPFKK